MKSSLLHALVLGSLVLTAPASAQENSPFHRNHGAVGIEISPERHQALGQAVASHPKVRPLIRAAQMLHQQESTTFYVDKIDPGSRPVAFGRELEDYSEISLYGSYGWYADPAMIIRVTGFIKTEKVPDGNLILEGEDAGWGDLIITEVHIASPMPTGLE